MIFSAKTLFTLFCWSAILFAFSQTLSAQTGEKRVKWHGLSGKDEEFYFLIPEGFQTYVDRDYYYGRSGRGNRIENRITAARYINGVVLVMDFYEGVIKELQKDLAARRKSELVKEETINGFEFKTYAAKTADYIWEQQHFIIKDRLYVMQAIYRDEQNAVARHFFQSVRLVNQKQAAAPNFPKDVKKEILSALPPEIVDTAVDPQLIEEKPDKEAVVIYQPRPPFNREFGRTNTGKVRMKVLLSSTGKVEKIETVESPNFALEEGVRKTVKQTVFLPAEKSGKPVSSWKIIQYGFETSVYIS